MWLNARNTADLVTFTDKIRHRKLYFGAARDRLKTCCANVHIYFSASPRSAACFISIPPEIIRKPLVFFWLFQGYDNGTCSRILKSIRIRQIFIQIGLHVESLVTRPFHFTFVLRLVMKGIITIIFASLRLYLL